MPAERPDDVDQEFARLVAGFDAPVDPAGGRPPWPADEDVAEPAPGPSVEPLPLSDEAAEPAEPPVREEEHYVPPPPPPVPRPDARAALAWAGALGSPVLLVLATAVGWTPPRLLLLALVVGFVIGVVALIARLGRRPGEPFDPDDGAVV